MFFFSIEILWQNPFYLHICNKRYLSGLPSITPSLMNALIEFTDMDYFVLSFVVFLFLFVLCIFGVGVLHQPFSLLSFITSNYLLVNLSWGRSFVLSLVVLNCLVADASFIVSVLSFVELNCLIRHISVSWWLICCHRFLLLSSSSSSSPTLSLLVR
jgi:branched-subunit amino acid transport protein AzlD